MQFYIIDDNPKKSAFFLPDYALKRVNLREGYQILSDIGHAADVFWECQNKEYNRYHAETRQYWKNEESFEYFLSHYEACILEYEKRYNKTCPWITKYLTFRYSVKFDVICYIRKKQAALGPKWQIKEYLTTVKAKHLTPKEIKVLQED